MNTQTNSLDICQFIERHLIEVFETMLSMPAEIAPGVQMPQFPQRVTGSVGFGGDHINGAVYLHLSATYAHRCACAMLGLESHEVNGENEVNDVVGEMTNMLAGGLKSALCDNGQPCAISTPAIIRGAFEIEALPDVSREFIVFRSSGEFLMVEIHLKNN